MPLKLDLGSGFAEMRSHEFPDDLALIRFGRGIDCEVGFPEEVTAIGHDHFALRREAGGYKLVVNSRHPVFVNGHEAYDDMELPDACELRLGRADGPALRVQVLRARASNMLPTDVASPSLTIGQIVNRNRRRIVLIGTVTAGVVVAMTVGFFALRQIGGEAGDALVLAKQSEAKSDISSIVARVRDSVYLVTVLDRFGESLGEGTAWVVALPDGRRAFATNAHVAEIFHEVQANADGQRLIVRAPAAPHRDYEIVDVAVHPGHSAFAQFRMSMQSKIEQGLMRPFRDNGYDVALLIPKEQDGIGEPLTIADRSDLNALKAGEPVFLVGYPMERVDATDVKAPSPTSQRGIITSLTTFFLTPDPVEDQLVQHSLPSAGGASGSPIFNSQGKVIALHNAGSYFFATEGRIPLAALVNFGQRADLLLELIDGSANASMPRYQTLWAREVKGLERPAEAAAEERITAFVVEKPSAVRAVDKEVMVETTDPLFNGRIGMIEPLTLSAGSDYLFVVHTADRRSLSVIIYDAASSYQYLAVDGAGPLAYARATVPDKIAVRLAIVATDMDEAGNPILSPVKAKLVVMRNGGP